MYIKVDSEEKPAVINLEDDTNEEEPLHSPAPDYDSAEESVASPIQQASSLNPNQIPTQSDGVFSNLSAKKVKTFEEIEPPSYASAIHPTNTDAHLQAAMQPQLIFSVDEEGEILVEDIPVGNLFILFMNMLISMSFDLVGFLVNIL